MAVTVKIKSKHTGADAKKVAAAFHEVHTNPPAIVAKTRRKSGPGQARKQEVAIALSKARAAGASIPGPSGANYVSRDELHVPPGARQTWQRGGKTVAPSGQCDAGKNPSDLHNYPTTAEYVADRFPDVHYGDAQVSHEIKMETVEHVKRPMNSVEQIRQRNNQARDFRTNLGRGKAAQPTVGESGDVVESR
jgi:hypothetical protein